MANITVIPATKTLHGIPLQRRHRGHGNALMPKNKTARDGDQAVLITGFLCVKRL